MVKVYKGLTTKDKRLKTLRTGFVPSYTWFTTNPEEAAAYARSKSQGSHGDESAYGGSPVVVSAEVPETYAWELGGGGFGMKSKYYKTNRGLRTPVEVSEI